MSDFSTEQFQREVVLCRALGLQFFGDTALDRRIAQVRGAIIDRHLADIKVDRYDLTYRAAFEQTYKQSLTEQHA